MPKKSKYKIKIQKKCLFCKKLFWGFNNKKYCCKNCQRFSFLKRNPDYIKINNDKYYKNNRLKNILYARSYRKNHRKEYSKYYEKYYKKNKKKIAKKNKDRYIRLKDQIPNYNKKIYSKNRDRIFAYMSTFEYRFNRRKREAIKSGKKWSIKIEDFINLPLICYYTKRKLTLDRNKFNTLSFDRIDSKKGYIKGNVVMACDMVNCAKNDLSMKEFKKMIRDLNKNIRNF